MDAVAWNRCGSPPVVTNALEPSQPATPSSTRERSMTSRRSGIDISNAPSGWCRFSDSILTMRPGSPNGRSANRMPRTAEKMNELTPMPSAITAVTVNVNPGVRRSERRA